MRITSRTYFAAVLLLTSILIVPALAQSQVKTANGLIEGTVDSGTGIRSFKGVAFAEPPVGDLRWKPPQPLKKWSGVRKADQFGPRAMQRPIYSDMVFRSNGVSEDCLYLNIWTPAKSDKERLPVLVYFYGGGFQAGDGSELRYDGASMARQGIVALTVNYRLGVFGFFAHPELTKESAQHASGNQGLLDQAAALLWVQKNIAAFGGDPKRVTIAGESAGSTSVSAQMASPLSRMLIAGAIGESGSALSANPPMTLSEGEQNGTKFGSLMGASSLAALRAIPAQVLLDATAKPDTPRFSSVVDGYFYPKPAVEIFAAGEQAHVPLLVGSNSEESGFESILAKEAPTAENYAKAVQRLFGERAEEVMKLYPSGSTPTEIMQTAMELASDRFTGFSTWRWLDRATKTGGQPTYYYYYTRPRPVQRPPESGVPTPGVVRGAAHSAEIEYAMGNLETNKVFAWAPEDYQISKTMQAYFANFIKTGDPNGAGLPKWPRYSDGSRLTIDVVTRAEPDRVRVRYEFWEKYYLKK